MVFSCFEDLRPEPLATHLTPIPPAQHFLSSCHAGCGCPDRPRKQFLSSLPSRNSEPREKINASIVTMTLIRGIPVKLERSPKHPPAPSSRSPDYRLALSWARPLLLLSFFVPVFSLSVLGMALRISSAHHTSSAFRLVLHFLTHYGVYICCLRWSLIWPQAVFGFSYS